MSAQIRGLSAPSAGKFRYYDKAEAPNFEKNFKDTYIGSHRTPLWDEGTKNGPDRSALLGHNFVYQETKPHGFYSSYFHQRISS